MMAAHEVRFREAYEVTTKKRSGMKRLQGVTGAPFKRNAGKESNVLVIVIDGRGGSQQM